jgi:hypothetical protein
MEANRHSTQAPPGWKLISVREYLETHRGRHALVVAVTAVSPFVGLALGDLVGLVVGGALSVVGYFGGRLAQIKVRELETVDSGSLDADGMTVGVKLISAKLEAVREPDGDRPLAESSEGKGA